jgi:two-component system, LuxR family, sensor kinase FixL
LRLFLKRGDLKPRPLSVDKLLYETVELTRPHATSRRVTLEITEAQGLPLVSGDQVHLQQVLLNLVLNAMEAMNGDQNNQGSVTLGALNNPAGTVEVFVSDNGPGIPIQNAAHLFEPFFTTKQRGMGLGLAISRTIIEAHGGRLWAEQNGAHRGATFRFTLPVSPAECAL